MAPRTYWALQNFHGHEKEFRRNLLTIWAGALKNVRQPWCMLAHHSNTDHAKREREREREIDREREREREACFNSDTASKVWRGERGCR